MTALNGLALGGGYQFVESDISSQSICAFVDILEFFAVMIFLHLIEVYFVHLTVTYLKFLLYNIANLVESMQVISVS